MFMFITKKRLNVMLEKIVEETRADIYRRLYEEHKRFERELIELKHHIYDLEVRTKMKN